MWPVHACRPGDDSAHAHAHAHATMAAATLRGPLKHVTTCPDSAATEASPIDQLIGWLDYTGLIGKIWSHMVMVIVCAMRGFTNRASLYRDCMQKRLVAIGTAYMSCLRM